MPGIGGAQDLWTCCVQESCEALKVFEKRWYMLINYCEVEVAYKMRASTNKGLSTLIRFQTKTELFCSVFKKDLRPHLSFSYRFRPSTLQRRIRFENAFIPSVRMLKWTRRMRLSIYLPAKLARNCSHMVASVRHFGYSRSSGLAPGSVYFDDVTYIHTYILYSLSS